MKLNDFNGPILPVDPQENSIVCRSLVVKAIQSEPGLFVSKILKAHNIFDKLIFNHLHLLKLVFLWECFLEFFETFSSDWHKSFLIELESCREFQQHLKFLIRDLWSFLLQSFYLFTLEKSLGQSLVTSFWQGRKESIAYLGIGVMLGDI